MELKGKSWEEEEASGGNSLEEEVEGGAAVVEEAVPYKQLCISYNPQHKCGGML